MVRVQSHGSVPICAWANGPDDGKGRPIGVRKGEHYVRVPGSKSVAAAEPSRGSLLDTATGDETEAIETDLREHNRLASTRDEILAPD